MRYLFDTSVAISLRDGDERIIGRCATIDPVPLVSVITIVELEGGAVTAAEGRVQRRAALDAIYENLDVLPFEEAEALAYGRIVGELGFSRTKITDRMIAAQALVADATVATLNPRDFRNIPDLKLEDWS